MFAYAPVLIIQAPYESTMGLVQKIFYFHFPSWIVMFSAAFVCGVASAVYLFSGRAAADRAAVAAAELAVAVRPDRPDHRAVVGAQGMGRLVAVGRAADLRARAVADLRRVSAAAALRRARVGEAVGGDRAVRHGQRAVRLLVGERLADGASQDHSGLDAAARHARAVLVVLVAFMLPVRRCCSPPACGSRRRRAELEGLFLALED